MGSGAGGDALVEEYDGSGTLQRRYAHWAGSDVPLLSFTDSDLNSPNYLHADQQGSIVMLSGAGTPTINRYDEYGIPRSGNVGRFQYTGQARWYRILLVAWLLTVVPVAMLAYGFGGDRFVFPDIGAFGVGEAITFIATSAWALSPLLLAPWGLRRRR